MEIIERSTDANRSEFTFKDEDHTLANLLSLALRSIEGVVHAGYRTPHPLSRETILYVQTGGALSPREALAQAVESVKADVSELLKVV